MGPRVKSFFASSLRQTWNWKKKQKEKTDKKKKKFCSGPKLMLEGGKSKQESFTSEEAPT